MKPEGAIYKEQPVESRKTPMIIRISRSTLLKAIRVHHDIPDDASITFHVPGGGDWSNMDVELDDQEQVISVRYER